MRTFLKILHKAAMNWLDHNATTLGAALAYYAVFSLAPLFMITMAIVGFIYGEEAARGEIASKLQELVGSEAAMAVQSIIGSARGLGSGGAATLIGLAMVLFGASGVFVSLQTSLNIIWGLAPTKGLGVVAFIRRRALTFAMTLCVGLVLIGSLMLTAWLTAAESYLSDYIPSWTRLDQAMNFGISFAVITVMFALIFRLLPDASIAWRDVWVGAALTAVLFLVGKYLIGFYLGRAGVTSTFGAAGSLIAVLVWVYYNSLILFFGAEVTHAYAEEVGSRREARLQAAVTKELVTQDPEI